MKGVPYREGRGRSHGLLRVLRLARLLETIQRPIGLDELAERFGTHPRTIRRDLALLVAAGAAVASNANAKDGNAPLEIYDFTWREEVLWIANPDVVSRPSA